jgi:tRNA dimethylallyltransferase
LKLVAVVGPTAAGKSTLGLDLALRFGGEVVSCDSTAVYRGIDIGTDKPGPDERRQVRHHLLDVVEPTEPYSAARYAADAAAAIRDIDARGRVPVLVGGTGLYYRALVRGLFPGPARDTAVRARLDRVAARRGTEALHRWLGRVDDASARRIHPRDRKRLVRALEVYLLTGRPLTEHFEATAPPVAGLEVLAIGVVLARPQLQDRVVRRVDAQFRRGVVAEVERLLAAGVPRSAHALGGLVYRQVVEYLQGVRDEAATRTLIVRENMRYARRQLTWFRREPGIRWLQGAGESVSVRSGAAALVGAFLEPDGRVRQTAAGPVVLSHHAGGGVDDNRPS